MTTDALRATLTTLLQSGTLSTISAPVGIPKAELHQSFDAWLKSGDAQMPVTVQNKINERLAW